LINRFRNRRTRERLERDLADILTESSLPRLLDFLDNADEKHLDTFQFTKARSEFGLAARAIERCELERASLPEEAELIASSVAAGLSMVVGVLGVLVSFLALGSF
jgi:hypothetical protein